MKRLTIKHNNYVFCRSSNTCSIHVYENESRKGIIRSDYPVKDFCIINDGAGGWILYCLTSEGQLLQVNRGQVCNCEQGNFSEEDDIFNDLLTEESDNLQLAPSTEPFYQLTSVNLVQIFSKDTITSLCVDRNILLLVFQHPSCYEIKLFTGELISAPTCTKFSLQKQFMVSFPIASHNLTISISPRIFYVTCLAAEGEKAILSSDHIKLSEGLFKSLFGSETVLLNSLIILFCPVFGSVFYSPVKTVDDHNFKTGFQNLTLFCQTSNQVIGIEYVQFPTKWGHDLEREEENRNRNQDGLFLATRDGKCILISSWNKCGVQFVPVIISGPLVSFGVHTNTLYYSTERDLFEGEISAEVDSSSGMVTTSIINQKSLQQYNVQSLVTLQNQSLVEGTPCLVFCRSSNGKCRVVNPDHLKQKTKSLGTDNYGQKIKDVLISLEKCQIEREKLKAHQKVQSSFISQLSIASFLICTNDKAVMFKHKYNITYLPHSLEFELNYELTNESKVILSHDWKVLLSIRHLDSSLTKSVVYTLANGLKPNECIAISTVLLDDNIYLPFEVQIYLELAIPSHLEIETDMHVESSKILPVYLASEILDIIYFVGDEKHQKRYINRPPKDVEQVVTEIAITRPMSKCLLVPQKVTDKSVEPVTFTLHKSIHILNSKDIRKYGKDEIAVLKYLLEDSKHILDVTCKAIALSVSGGSKVHIGVSIDGQVVITIQSTDLALCTAVRMAVLKRLKDPENRGDQIVNMSKIQASFKQYEELLKELQHLEERIAITDSNETRNNILQIYKKLRESQPFIQ